MPCRPANPTGKIPAPLWGDATAFNRWAKWVNESIAVNQQGVIVDVEANCQHLDLEPLRTLGAGFVLRASVPPDQRGASPCPYVEGALVIFAPVLGGTDQGHVSAIMEPSAQTPFLVTVPCCPGQLAKATLQATGTITCPGGPGAGTCSGKTTELAWSTDAIAGANQPASLTEADGYWRGELPFDVSGGGDFDLILYCQGGDVSSAEAAWYDNASGDFFSLSQPTVNNFSCPPNVTCSIPNGYPQSNTCCSGSGNFTIDIQS